jgi:hypothetical protein
MDFVLVRAFDNYIYAHICLTRLQDAGINCHLVDEITITIDPLLSPALGGIKLMVHVSQAKRAMEILDDLAPD